MKSNERYKGQPSEIVSITKTKEVAKMKFEFVERLLAQYGIILVNKDSKVLDVGCGEGYLLEYLKDRNIDATGIELADSPRHKTLKVVKADAHKLPFEDGSFDIVWSSGIYDPDLYDQEPATILKEILRVLKNRGVYIIDDADQPYIPDNPRIIKIIDNLNITETARLSVIGKY